MKRDVENSLPHNITKDLKAKKKADVKSYLSYNLVMI